MDPSEWRCACVDDMEGYNGMMRRDLSNVMHRDSAVEGGATRHEKGDSWEIYLRAGVNCDLARRYVDGLNLSQHSPRQGKIVFGLNLSRNYWPSGHENPAMGFFWGVDQD
jgi:hypothetical protein